jgi:glycosyltransferase involved in cell wall biosynthesis
MPKKLKGKKSKIFIGLHEICDYTLRLAQGMRELDYDVTHVLMHTGKTAPFKEREDKPDRYIYYYDNWAVLQVKLFREFLHDFMSHDVFIFNIGTGFFSQGLETMHPMLYKLYSKHLDWRLLKSMGKKIVVVNHGCDIRHYQSMEAWAKKKNIKYTVCMNCDQRDQCYLTMKSFKVKMIEKYADHIFSKSNAAYLYKRPYNYVWLPVKLSDFSSKVHTTDEPLILHAPSAPAKKGTSYILDAIERLKGEGYKFKFKLCKNMVHAELMEHMVEAEIVIDQLLSWNGNYSLFSIEGMATGNVVLTSVIPNYKDTPPDTPIIPSNPDNIYENLKKVLDNPELRTDLSEKGLKFVKKYHEYKSVAKQFLKDIDEWVE